LRLRALVGVTLSFAIVVAQLTAALADNLNNQLAFGSF
jgi:hypothetical protein